jgi:hypothetical protein
MPNSLTTSYNVAGYEKHLSAVYIAPCVRLGVPYAKFKAGVKRMDTPIYIKSLLTPNGKKPADRRVWSVPLEAVWQPFFMATNLQGDTALPMDALGAPLRLAYNQDGSVKFGKTGKAVIKVAKPIADSVKMVRENFVANLVSYTEQVRESNASGFEALEKKATKAGKPIIANDRANLDKAIAEAMAKSMAEAEAETPTAPQAEKQAVTA